MPAANKIIHIDEPHDLEKFSGRCRKSSLIGFDTEFVSENRYRPELCLLQVATEKEIAIIDTVKLSDLSAFWDVLTTGEHITIAHAAREEFLFCFRACGKRPQKLFDIQLAAAFVGYDYPASYSNLVSQILGQHVSKGETRTDWRKRPLTQRQINYAVGDVEHLHSLCQSITTFLEEFERKSWYVEEVQAWMSDLEKGEAEPQWHRVSGASRLNRRELGILQELWALREEQAEKKNRSAKRTIPDDLLIELAKRGSAEPANFKAIRGFDSRVNKGLTNSISEAIERGNNVPDSDLPSKLDRGKSLNLGLLGQFLTTILSVVCKKQKIAPNLVGTSQDLRQLAASRLGMLPAKIVPGLAKGWRAEIVGSAIEKAIDGKVVLRVEDAKSNHPLTIEQID